MEVLNLDILTENTERGGSTQQKEIPVVPNQKLNEMDAGFALANDADVWQVGKRSCFQPF